ESTASEMAQEEFDPLDLMSGVAMLVLEARTPDNSVKGRVEGPHCPSFKHEGRHMCSKETLECLRALEFRERINMMWKNGIPSCIDILLFPVCSHGLDEARSLEGAASNMHENSILLERWTIQCIQKWHGEWSSGVSGSMLLQAVRSYLYFSQLSSWLTSMHGCLPITIAYRLYAPGEEAGVNFVEPADSHAFPTGIYGPHGLRVHVLALPRQEHVPALLCALAGEQGDAGSLLGVCGLPPTMTSRETKREDDGEEFGGVKPKRFTRCRTAGHTDRPPPTKEERRRMKQRAAACHTLASEDGQPNFGDGFPQKATPLHHPKTAEQLGRTPSSRERGESPKVTVSEEAGAKFKGQRSSSRERLEGQLRPLELSAGAPAHSFDLHSPKVLMSADAQMPHNLITKKKCIDFRNRGNQSTDDHYPTFDSMEDKLFLTRHFRDLQSPLSPLDIQSFLANLHTISGPIPPHIRLPKSLAAELAAKKAASEWQGADSCELYVTPEVGLNVPGKKPLHALSSPSVDELKPQTENSLYESMLLLKPGAASAHCLPTRMPHQRAKTQAKEMSSFGKSPLALDQDCYASRKKQLIAVAQQWSETCSEGRREKQDGDQKTSVMKITPAASDQEFVEQLPKRGLSVSIDQTLRDINKIVRARKTKSIDHEFQDCQTAAGAHSAETADVKSHGGKTETTSGVSKLACEEKSVTTENTSHAPPETSSNLTVSNGDSSSSPFQSQTRSFETPDAVNGVYTDGRAKRRLHLDFGADGIPNSHAQDSNNSQSLMHAEAVCHSTDKVDLSELCEDDRAKSPNIPKSSYRQSPPRQVKSSEQSSRSNKQSPQKQVRSGEQSPPQQARSCEQDSPGVTQLSQGDHRKQGAASVDSSLTHSQDRCDQTKTSSDSSVCKFYLESPLSPSPSLASLSNGAFTAQSLSAWEQKFSADEDSLIEHWQQLSVEIKDLDNTCRGTCVDNDRTQYKSEKSSVADLPSSVAVDIEDDDSSRFGNFTHSSNFTDKAAVPASGREIHNATHLTARNGAVESNEDTSDDGRDNDEVFSNEQETAHSKKRHGPTRAKSAPNFASMSAKGKVTPEADGRSSDGVTRGRLATRDKSLLELGSKGASAQDRLRHRLVKSASMLFSSRSGLPSQSSPAPVKRRSTGRFDYDETLTSTKAIKNAISMSRLPDVSQYSTDGKSESGRFLSTSAPASTNSLLGNFEESILNGRLEPAGMVDGFTVDVGASGSFCPRHLSLPVTAYFFHLSDDNAPSPYLGHIGLDEVSKKGYHIPRKGTLQVTLFNPNKTVVKMFVVMYDLADMPPDSRTVIRQRTVYMPVDADSDEPSYLRYLIHLRVASSSSGKIYLHTDIRLIFARNKFELDSSVAKYELRSFTETPVNPKYSPKR
ncbi:hypothetical protein BaRGS_00036328, partial [Batillaria attramentaria]